MKRELIFSGIGGQGTILMGKMICTAAAKKAIMLHFLLLMDKKKEEAEQAVKWLFLKKWAL